MSNKALEILEHRVDLTTPYEEPEWIEEPFVARANLTLFAGREGEGKSLVEQDAAIRYAHAGFKVLILDAENGPRLLAERLQKLGLDPVENVETMRRISIYAPDSFDLGNSEDFMSFQQMVMVEEPDVVILDSFQSLYGASLSSPKVKGVMELLRKIAQRANCAIILLHHTTKSGNTYVGSGAIGRTAEMVYFMLRHKDDPDPQRRMISCYKNRLTKEPDDIWIQIVAEASGKVLQIDPAEPFVAPPIGGHDMLTSHMMLALLTNEAENPNAPYLSVTELCKKVNRTDTDRSVRRILKALEELGHIQRVQSPTSKASNPRWMYKATSTDTDVDAVLQDMKEGSA